jgi:hypothetical protein
VLKVHVANVCFKCFRCFRGMLQVFMRMLQKYIEMLHMLQVFLEPCCKCFKDMLQAFVQNVSSVSDVCCKSFNLDVAYVSHIYVARVCSKCFSCFNLMLQ